VTIVDLHPEELIDRARESGAPDPRVEAHLASCAACRLAAQLEADFADEAPTQRPPPAPPPRRRAARAVLAVGAVACAIGAVVPWLFVAPPPTTASAEVAGREPAPMKRVVDPPDHLVPSASIPSSPRPASESVTVAAVFDAANRARRAGDYDDAIALYAGLLDRFPRSAEARASELILGRLLLDRGDAAGAVVAFDGCLARPGPDLHEEALIGRALALDRLGRPDAPEAWRDLIRRFPLSPYVAHALERVSDVERPRPRPLGPPF
jgi:TolA-binding protein